MTPTGILMRSPCGKCSAEEGRIEVKGGQDCVYCVNCGAWQYNAPRVETGRKERTILTVHEAIKPSARARILMRASGHCEICGSVPTAEFPLHVGHMLSVKDAVRLGLNDGEINCEENLAAMCTACNLGIGETTVPLRLVYGIIAARCRNKNQNPV